MTQYILSIVGVVLLLALIAIVAPSGKMGQFLKGATKLVTLFVMLAPLRGLISGEGLTFSVAELETDEAYLAYCAQELAAQDEEEIVLWLDETYGVAGQAQVERNADTTFSYQKIAVTITNFGIYEQDEHIHISEQIENALETRYGCEAEVM